MGSRGRRSRRRRQISRGARSLGYLARWHTERAPGTVTPELIDHLIDFQNHRCWYCHTGLCRAAGSKRNWCLEHKIPVSRGGTNEASNLVIACKLCNKLKNTQTAEEFLARTNRPDSEATFQARGTVTTNGGTGLSTTLGAQEIPHREPTGTREQTCRTSPVAAMVRSHGERHSGKALSDPAHDEGTLRHGDASRGETPDAAYRQSPAQKPFFRLGRSGMNEETRAD